MLSVAVPNSLAPCSWSGVKEHELDTKFPIKCQEKTELKSNAGERVFEILPFSAAQCLSNVNRVHSPGATDHNLALFPYRGVPSSQSCSHLLLVLFISGILHCWLSRGPASTGWMAPKALSLVVRALSSGRYRCRRVRRS